MKFRFCGEGDCPDWVLAEIISTLSVLSAQKLETLATLVAKKINGQAFEEDAIKSVTAEVTDDGKSAVACVHFLLINAARHNASESVFNEEIQQLGLPKEHAAAMCRVLNANATPIRKKLIAKSLKINELAGVQYIPASDDDTINCAKFELKISKELVDGLPQDKTHFIHIDRANLKALLEELKEARNIMQKYDMENIEKIIS